MELVETFLSDYNTLQKDKALHTVSPKDKWNLKMDIADVKKDFIELQNTAEKLPDAFVDEMCNTESYPFEKPVDEVTDINAWCNEANDFLKDVEKFGITESIFEKIYKQSM